METQKVALSSIKLNPNNPRTVKDENFDRLVQSMKTARYMEQLRPIVVDEDWIILGGNMRYKALKHLKRKEAVVNVLTNAMIDEAIKLHFEETWVMVDAEYIKGEFLVKDNVAIWDWDFPALNELWGADLLDEWGVVQNEEETIEGEELEIDNDDTYTKKIEAPLYEPSWKKYNIGELYDSTKTSELIRKIYDADISEQEKEFLIMSAYRHTVFDYWKIADYFANASKEIQWLMQDSALVIIDFDKAIEWGFVELSDNLKNLYAKEYPED